MCSLPPHNSPGSPRSVVASPNLVMMKSLPLATGLGLSLTIGLLHAGRTIAQTIPSQEIAQLSTAQTAVPASAQHLLFVSPLVGSDTDADGSQRSPFRTITHALQVAQPNTVILLTTGTYSAETGEVFPLMLKPDVTIQGDPSTQGRGIVIRGGGAFLSPTSAGQNIAILGANQSQLVGVTVTNPNPRGYGVWVESSNPAITNSSFTGNTQDGISTVGSSAPLIRKNRFTGNGANGITVSGQSQPEIRENVFEQTGFAITVTESAAPLIVNNQMNQNEVAVSVQANARPVLRGNTIESSQQDGITAVAHAQPNLGTADDPGNNIFRNNALDLNAATTDQMIPAFGNQLSIDRVAGKVDWAGTASVVAAQSTATIRSASLQTTRATPPSQPIHARGTVSQTSRSAAAPSPAPTITELPPSTISTLPPTAPQSVASIAPPSPHTNSPSNTAEVRPSPTPVARSTPATEIRVPPPASRPAIVPIAQPRSTQPTGSMQPIRSAQPTGSMQPTVEISVPPADNALQPAVASRTQAAPSPVTPISAPLSVSPAQAAASPTLITASRSVPSSSPLTGALPSEQSISPHSPSTQPLPVQMVAAQTPSPRSSSIPLPSTQSPATVLVRSAPGPSQPTPSAGAIEIPVPPPESPPSTTLAYVPRSVSTFNTPIEIPVPLPESGAVAPVAVRNQNLPSSPPSPGAVSSANLLPVPNGDAPIGNVGDMPRVSVASTQMGGMYYASSQIRSALRYRVVVDASGAGMQSLVQSIIPNAFLTSVGGQQLMQVGAFNSRDNAEQTVQMLNQNGLVAVIQEIE